MNGVLMILKLFINNITEKDLENMLKDGCKNFNIICKQCLQLAHMAKYIDTSMTFSLIYHMMYMKDYANTPLV